MTYKITFEPKGVYVQFSDLFTFVENYEVADKVYAYSQKNTVEYVIWDLTTVEHLVMSEFEAVSLAAIDYGAPPSLDNIKMILIAQNEAAIALIKKCIETSREMQTKCKGQE